MKTTLVALSAMAAIITAPAFAGDDMAGMKMSTDASTSGAHATGLTDAEVKAIDSATGMVTLKHGALDNVGMPAMTMAFKAKDAAMLKQVHEGDKVRVRVENVSGALTIVKLEKRS